MSRKDLILEHFRKDGEEDGTTYYVLYPDYQCLYNDEEPITQIEIDEDGCVLAGSDINEPCEFAESDWDLVTIHRTTKVL